MQVNWRLHMGLSGKQASKMRTMGGWHGWVLRNMGGRAGTTSRHFGVQAGVQVSRKEAGTGVTCRKPGGKSRNNHITVGCCKCHNCKSIARHPNSNRIPAGMLQWLQLYCSCMLHCIHGEKCTKEEGRPILKPEQLKTTLIYLNSQLEMKLMLS